MNEERKAYQKKLQAQYDEWSAEIDMLRAKASNAGADMQIEYQNRLKELRAMQDAAEQRMSELKNASDDAWMDLKDGINDAWNSLGNAVRSASSRF